MRAGKLITTSLDLVNYIFKLIIINKCFLKKSSFKVYSSLKIIATYLLSHFIEKIDTVGVL